MSTRWRIFAVLSFMYVMAYFYRISLAVVAKDVAAELSLSAAQLGTLSGIFFYVYGFVQIPLGPLLDRFGGKRVIVLFGFLTAAGGFLFAAADGFYSAACARILIGTGTACVLMGSLKIFTAWFTKAEFGRISGFMVAVGNLGNLGATAPLAFCAAHFGWRSSFVGAAALQSLVVLLTATVVRERALPEEEEAGAKIGMIAAWRMIFADRSFLLLGLLAFAWYGNYMVLQGLWGGPYLIDAVGLSREQAGGVLLFTSLGFITGSFFLGTITDRVFRSHKRTLLAGQGLLVLLMGVMLGPAETLPPLLLKGVFFLLGIGVSSGVTIYPVVREMFPARIAGTGLTSVNFFVLMGAASVQQGMGLVISRYPRTAGAYPAAAYHAAFLIPIATLVVAWVLFLFSRDTHPQRR